MEREDEKKFTLDEYSWHILNNLEKFNDKPDLVESVYYRMTKFLPDHTILQKFYDYYKTALKYREDHGSFPDINWFEINYAKSGKFKRTDNEFSIKVYEDYIKRIELEILKRDCQALIKEVDPDVDTVRQLVENMSRYCDTTEKIPALTKGGIISLYDDYIKDYVGIESGIPDLDAQIGVLGHKSLMTFGAPSGHGKSTFAITTCYNVAVKQGGCVDYISYEVPKEHIWFNLVSMHSKMMARSKLIEDSEQLSASDIKEGRLDDKQKEIYYKVARDLLDRLNESGGYIGIIDQTTAHVDTFEALCARLEAIADERIDGDRTYNRKADLIIIDNVDNLQVLRSKERDEMVKVNNYIISFDAFCKKYHNGDGCVIMLLTQLNRTGMKQLNKDGLTDAQNTSSTEVPEIKIDVTVFQKFNALYEKSTVCLVGHANPNMRLVGTMHIYPVKLRNRQVPTHAIDLRSDFAHSTIGEDNFKFNRKATMEELIANMMAIPKRSELALNYAVDDAFSDGEF